MLRAWKSMGSSVAFYGTLLAILSLFLMPYKFTASSSETALYTFSFNALAALTATTANQSNAGSSSINVNGTSNFNISALQAAGTTPDPKAIAIPLGLEILLAFIVCLIAVIRIFNERRAGASSRRGPIIWIIGSVAALVCLYFSYMNDFVLSPGNTIATGFWVYGAGMALAVLGGLMELVFTAPLKPESQQA